MRILLINHYAGSLRHGMEYRPYYLGREWTRQGHEVTIAAASIAHVRSQQPDISGWLTEQNIDGMRYLWLKTPSYRGNGVARTANMLAFVSQLMLRAGALASKLKPDLVIASSTYPLDMTPASRVARAAGARLVFEVHDLWPLSPVELGGMSTRHPFIALMQWGENYAYRRADKVVSLLPCAARHMIAHGMAPDKFIYIPNGINVSEWQAAPGPLPPEHERLIHDPQLAGAFRIGYAGAHGVANSLDTILDAAALLTSEPVAFFLMGQGPEKERLQALAKQRSLERVIFLPPAPKAAVPSFLAQMDGLCLTLQRQPLFRFGISPNKLMDYMMAERPVIQAIEAPNDMVAESGCGITVPPQDPRALADAVLRLMRISAEERAVMGRRGKAYVTANHDYSVLARQFIEAVTGEGARN